MSKTFKELVEALRAREDESDKENKFIEDEDDPSYGAVGGDPRAEGEKVFAKAHGYPVDATGPNNTPYPAKDTDDVLNARKTIKTTHKIGPPESKVEQGTSKLPDQSGFKGSRTSTRANSTETRGDAEVVRTSPSAVKGLQESAFTQLQTIRFQDGDEAFVSAKSAAKIMDTVKSLKPDNAKKFQDTINSSPAGLMKMMKFAGGND